MNINKLEFSVFSEYWEHEQKIDMLELELKIKQDGQAIRTNYLDAEKDKQRGEMHSIKSKLLAFTPIGVFNEQRTLSSLVSYSSMVLLELDNIPTVEVQTVRNKLKQCPFTRLSFSSISTRGFKILVEVNSTVRDHAVAFKEVAKYYSDLLGYKINPSGEDPLRLCYISYDPDIYCNGASQVFKVKSPAIQLSTLVVEPKGRMVDTSVTPLIQQTKVPMQLKMFDDTQIESGKESSTKDSYTEAHNATSLVEVADEDSPCRIPEEVYKNLPLSLRINCEQFNGYSRDVFFVASLAMLSSCVNSVFGNYRNKRVYANLFGFISGPSGSDKGVMTFALELMKGINSSLLRESQLDMAKYQSDLKKLPRDEEKLSVPAERIHLIPANVSSAALIRHLKENKGLGLICETEADSLTNAMSQDWGNFSDLLRKAFHHEDVSISRRGQGPKNDCLRLEKPRFSICLSGTPAQVTSLIKSAENGLFSRFMYYSINDSAPWNNPFNEISDLNLEDFFSRKALEVLSLYNFYSKLEVEFKLTVEQQQKFNQLFVKLREKYASQIGSDSVAIVNRMGIITFRIAMILTAIDAHDRGVVITILDCKDEFLQAALQVAETLIKHSFYQYEYLPKTSKQSLSPLQETFLKELSKKKEFDRNEAVKIGEEFEHKIAASTVDKYLGQLKKAGYLFSIKAGKYKVVADKVNQINNK